jgi:hypothetical protein
VNFCENFHNIQAARVVIESIIQISGNQTSSMKQSFTLNQCVRLIYGETTPEEQVMLREIISGNDRLRDEYENMQEVHRALGTDLLVPRVDATKAILKHSRDTALYLSC